MSKNLTVSQAGLPAPPAGVTNSSAQSRTLPPEVLAAISAAVTITLGKKAHIRRVRYWRARPTSAWAIQGRISIMNSHGVRR